MLNLDTHILLDAFNGQASPREKKILSSQSWCISAIVLWELSKLVQLKRIDVDLEAPEFLTNLSHVHIWPLDLKIARMSTKLDFKSDPADEIIAATSIVHGIPLLTRDRKIRKSKIVPLVSAKGQG